MSLEDDINELCPPPKQEFIVEKESFPGVALDHDLQGDEPSRSTLSGIPLCDGCGRSTRSRLQLRCKGCREKTTLILSPFDRELLRAMGIKNP